jgi:thioredoxin reductase (NADPH)
MITVDEIRSVPLFAGLDEHVLSRIASRAADLHLRPGEWAVREGEAAAFFVLLAGRIEITKTVAGRQQQLTIREPGEFFGEVPLLLGAPFLASFRAIEPSHVARVSAVDFASVLSVQPSVREVLTEALLERVRAVGEVEANATQRIMVVGTRFDPACHELRDFLARTFVESEWFDPGVEAERACLPPVAQAYDRLPLLVLTDDTVLVQPSLRAVAEAVGLSTMPARSEYDVVIIGGGPGGLAAAVYGASEGLQTLMIEQTAPGGQAGTSSRIENYLGFPTGVSGDDLASRALTQAKRFGAEVIVTRPVSAIEPGQEAHVLCLEDGSTIRSRAIVLSLGVSYRKVDVPGIERFVGAGVYYGAARAEAITTRGCDIFLIGGGNSAGQAAMLFSEYAARVTLLVRGPALTASMSQYLIDQLATRDNVAVRTNAEMIGVGGDTHLATIVVRDRARGIDETLPADAVFIFVGADANTGWLPQAIARDKQGFLLTGRDANAVAGAATLDRDRFLLETTVPGIFAAGDVRHGSVKRVAAAVGEGSMAIAFIHQHLATGRVANPASG